MKKLIYTDTFAVLATILVVTFFITIGALAFDGEPNSSKKPHAKASIEWCGSRTIVVRK